MLHQYSGTENLQLPNYENATTRASHCQDPTKLTLHCDSPVLRKICVQGSLAVSWINDATLFYTPMIRRVLDHQQSVLPTISPTPRRAGRMCFAFGFRVNLSMGLSEVFHNFRQLRQSMDCLPVILACSQFCHETFFR